MPEVRGRYYTAQLLDERGEFIANINERSFPSQPAPSNFHRISAWPRWETR
ncbi:hypothetical protein [Achromobacter denitrificans]|uniref:hypothetical protein n=1 Tax=Achromobacter denitrificans TaxID=32002 RepID=UPI003CD0450D